MMTGAYSQNNVPDWSEKPQSETLDVTTWNIEFFGRSDRGPTDIDLQFEEVKKLIEELGSDIFGLQEIWNNQMFAQLVDALDDYDGFISTYSSSMDVAFLYKKNTIEYLGHRLIDEQFGVDRGDIANRTLLEFAFKAKSEAVMDTIYVVNFHAQHGTNNDAFHLRQSASENIKNYFDENRHDKPLIFLGDYNDDVVYDIFRSYPAPYTPYYNFMMDEFYRVPTRSLSEAGERSHNRGMIDHIMINEHLFDFLLRGSETIIIPDDHEYFITTTSDHLPVTVRFDLTGSTIPPVIPPPQPGIITDWSDIPKTETFDVATWNVTWFGNPYWGPMDPDMQFDNVLQVLKDLDVDLIIMQEVRSIPRFVDLIGELEHYGGTISNYQESSFEVVLLYNTKTVDYLGRRWINEQYGMGRDFVERRPPVEYKFRVQTESSADTIYAIGYHAHQGVGTTAYDHRLNASNILKEYLDEHRKNDAVILLGTLNDDIQPHPGPIYPPPYTPYQNFMDDPFYTVITESLSEAGKSSHHRGMIDHIMINDYLKEFWHQGSEQVFDAFYIDDFLNSTSNHLPVMARFDIQSKFATDVHEPEVTSDRFRLIGNYPNPFNPSTNIVYELVSSGEVKLEIRNTMGQQVRVLELGQQPAGRHKATFDAGNLATGVYFIRMFVDQDIIQTHPVLFIK